VAARGDEILVAGGRSPAVDGGMAYAAFQLADGSTRWARRGAGTWGTLLVESDGRCFLGSDPVEPETPGRQGRRTGPPLTGGMLGGLLNPSMVQFFPKITAPGRDILAYWRFLGKPVQGAAWSADRAAIYAFPYGAGRDQKAVPQLSARLLERKADKQGASLQMAQADLWTLDLPAAVRVHALILMDATVVMAGVDRSGAPAGFVSTVGLADGKPTAECRLDGVPAFDAMMGLPGRVLVALQDGRLVCLGE
jgi:hypothetical protein